MAFKSAGGKVPIRWLAPECLKQRVYTHKSDVWAYGESLATKLASSSIIIIITSCNNTIGVTVWEILTFGARPYPDLKASEILTALQNGVRLKQPETCTLDLYAIILKCMFCFSIFLLYY